MRDIAKDTLKKIQEQHIVPKPKWEHILTKNSIWVIFILIIFLGSLSLAITSSLVSDLDWDIYPLTHRTRLAYTLSIFPYLWLIVIFVLLTAAFFGLRKTEKGYRYSTLTVMITSIGSVVLLGILFFFIGFGTNTQSMLQTRFPGYSRHVTTKETQWMQPEQGFLAGTLLSTSQNELILRDLQGNDWVILIDEKTFVRPAVNIEPKAMIKIIGTKSDKNTFQAIEIRPWNGKLMGNQKHNQQADNKPKHIPYKW